MSIIAQDTTRFSAVVKHEYRPDIGTCREAVIVNDAAATWKVGAVVGKVTASGKYKLCDSSAADGSQVAAGVYIADITGNSGDLVLAAATDTKVLILARGPARVAQEALTYGANVNTNPLKATLYAQLAAIGIVTDPAL